MKHSHVGTLTLAVTLMLTPGRPIAAQHARQIAAHDTTKGWNPMHFQRPSEADLRRMIGSVVASCSRQPALVHAAITDD